MPEAEISNVHCGHTRAASTGRLKWEPAPSCQRSLKSSPVSLGWFLDVVVTLPESWRSCWHRVVV